MKNNTETRPDYEEVFTTVAWDLDKAKYLVEDVQSFFETPDPDYPTRENLDGIKYEYKHILVMLGLLSDLVEKMADKVKPLM